MTPVPDQDAHAGLRDVLRDTRGCGCITESVGGPPVWATENAGRCDACADLLIAAIARQVEAETIERCAREIPAAAWLRRLPRLWSERSTPDA